MKNYKGIVVAGITLSSLGLVTLLYNLTNMYGLVGKCPENVDVVPCQAYDTWQLTNKIGLIVLLLGVVLLVAGLLKRQRKN